jgi:hypothetical protein
MVSVVDSNTYRNYQMVSLSVDGPMLKMISTMTSPMTKIFSDKFLVVLYITAPGAPRGSDLENSGGNIHAYLSDRYRNLF